MHGSRSRAHIKRITSAPHLEQAQFLIQIQVHPLLPISSPWSAEEIRSFPLTGLYHLHLPVGCALPPEYSASAYFLPPNEASQLMMGIPRTSLPCAAAPVLSPRQMRRKIYHRRPLGLQA